MKKLIPTLSLLSVAGAMAASIAFGRANQRPVEVRAEDPVTYIAMNADAFVNWTDEAGHFANVDATYWGEARSFEALDTFFRGEAAEGWTGTLELKSWTQTTPYIYFQWGGARYVANEKEDVNLQVVCQNTAGTLTKKYTLFNDTFTDNKMMLKYFVVPAEDFTALGGSNGFSMHINLVDGRTGDYGFNTFGYLHPNQTKAQVGDAMRYYLNHMSKTRNDYEIGMRRAIQGHYFGNGYLRDVFYATETSIDEDFENQSNFINHWYFDHKFFNHEGDEAHFDTVISDGTYRPGDSQMPFNKTGNGFFRGWYESSLNQGFITPDSPIYRFLSRPFVVSSANPFVSVKMAGTASLHVLDATVSQGEREDSDLAWIDNRCFNTGETGERVYSGFNTATMVRHVINLSAYAGRTVQLGIADYSSGGWGAAYFDELKVNVNVDSFKVDAIVQPTLNDGTFYSVYADRYVNSGHIDGNSEGVKYKVAEDGVADNTAQKEAYDFLKSYYALARQNGNGTSVCSVYTSDEMKALIGTTYNGLSEAAKRIVCASSDYEHAGATGENWFRTPVNTSTYTVGDTIEYILRVNNIDGVTYKNRLGNVLVQNPVASSLIFALLLGVVMVSTVLVVLKKKKRR